MSHRTEEVPGNGIFTAPTCEEDEFHTRHQLFTTPFLAGVGEDRVRESQRELIISQLRGPDLDDECAWGMSELEWVCGQVFQHMSDDLKRLSKV